MDWITFASNAIESLAWPTAIALTVWWLRGNIAELIPYTKRLKYKDLEIEFEKELSSLKKETEKQKRAHAVSSIQDKEDKKYIEQSADISPRAALVDSWVGLEITATSSAEMLELISDSRKPVPFPKVIKALLDNDIIDQNVANILKELQSLRNKALHSSKFNISKNEVLRFNELARDIGEVIASEAYNRKGGCGH